MGYYTRFDLNVTPKMTEEIETYVEDNEYMDYVFNGGDSAKWYEHESDMLEMSRKFPEKLFELSGEGEEAGDLWRKYFKNGKIQRCHAQITYEPFDEMKLKEAD